MSFLKFFFNNHDHWPWLWPRRYWPWPLRELALALASKTTGLGLGLEHAVLEPIPGLRCVWCATSTGVLYTIPTQVLQL